VRCGQEYHKRTEHGRAVKCAAVKRSYHRNKDHWNARIYARRLGISLQDYKEVRDTKRVLRQLAGMIEEVET